MGFVGMSQNRKVTCHIPGCKLYGKEMYADIMFLKKYLHTHHDHHELIEFAYEKGIITSKVGYISHEWLVNEIAHLCVLIEA